MLTYYRLLVISFILSLLAGIAFFIFYGSVIISLIGNVQDFSNQIQAPPDPEAILRLFFNPALIISGAIAGIASLTNRIIGIILIAGNKTMQEGERVLWILGFILMNIVTNIVFLALKNTRNLVTSSTPQDQGIAY
ncbi:MAG: hypothetical protein JNM21_17350 [Taibaiella sp.]|nr:hypothetical protein [Taibaiella sp.]